MSACAPSDVGRTPSAAVAPIAASSAADGSRAPEPSPERAATTEPSSRSEERLGIALPTGREVTSEALPEAEERVRGRSTAVVEAPLERVRAAVLAFDSYAGFMPHYRTSRILDRSVSETQVYMQVAALGGLVKMGAQITFPSKASEASGWQEYASRFDGGNVRDFRAVWRMRELAPSRTLLSLEVFLLPKLPLPTATLNGENTKGAREGVEAMRKHIEGT
jgi:hypothetical protein